MPHWSAAERFGELVSHVHANACSVFTMKMVCSAQIFGRLLLILAAHRAYILWPIVAVGQLSLLISVLVTWQNLSAVGFAYQIAAHVCQAMLCHDLVCCAVLCCAVLWLRWAVLCCAVLCCAVLCCAVLCCAVLGWAVLGWAVLG